MIRRLLFSVLFALALPAQDVSRLPEWARGPAQAAQAEAPPAGAWAWGLFLRQEAAYTGGGEVRVRTLRLVKVLGERGLQEGAYTLHSLGGRASRLKHLKGWNLRPDGELVKLERDDVAWTDADSDGEVSTRVRTSAWLQRVAPGSLVAFEALTVERLPMGPDKVWYLPEDIPIRRWELAFAKRGGFFSDLSEVASPLETRNWAEWGLRPEPLEGGGLAANAIPPLPEHERATPYLPDILPKVLLRFQDPGDLRSAPRTTWAALGAWLWARYDEVRAPGSIPGLAGLPPREALAAISRWMRRELVYRAVYLTPERGWIPVSPAEVMRRRYGDCKDLATCLIAEAAQAGLKAFPALCRIQDGAIADDAPVSAYAFNHVIAAIRLPESLGWPAEVETPAGRFLLVDATARYTPMGLLPPDHRGRRLLICTPEGGIWVRVPDTATARPRVEVDLDGAAEASGAVQATVRIRESADAWGLREVAHVGGLDDLRRHLVRTGFQIPPGGALTDLSTGDPLDVDRPFEVRFKLRHPQGWYTTGTRGTLIDWGLPSAPAAAQKPGVPRRLPFQRRANRELVIHAAWTLPAPAQPSLPELKSDTPLRSLRWTARAEGPRLLLDLEDRLKDADFSWDRRPEGVQAWKADRQLIQKLLDQGLRFQWGAGAP